MCFAVIVCFTIKGLGYFGEKDQVGFNSIQRKEFGYSRIKKGFRSVYQIIPNLKT